MIWIKILKTLFTLFITFGITIGGMLILMLYSYDLSAAWGYFFVLPAITYNFYMLHFIWLENAKGWFIWSEV